MNRLWLAAPLTVVAIALAACSGTATQSSAPLPDSVTSDTAVGSVTEGSVPAEDRGTNAPAPADRDVIRTATLTVVVPDAEPAVARLQQLATTSDGYLESVRTGPTPVPCAEGEPCPTIGIPEEAQGGVTTVVLRVPATDYDAALAQVRTLGDVVGLDVSADDVTTQVTDLAARIRAQRESVIRVRQLMKQASSLAEVVQIEQELASRQAELESLVSQQRQLSQSVQLATITAVLVPEAGAAAFVGTESHWWDAAWQTFVASWQGLVVLLAALSPLIVAGALIGGIVAAVIRRRRHSRRGIGSDQPAVSADA